MFLSHVSSLSFLSLTRMKRPIFHTSSGHLTITRSILKASLVHRMLGIMVTL
jgi:hypothetical protein